ncbi:hypothetical protein TEA_018614 [Camellia sinensis var. sinensis]|uniref:Glycosyltransferase n=1 Tax=Camellia sinensis var. sinensis TaxID=542762 RepID=A0A4S4E9E3_CAMSN|nr:hypothetical protein TEA_018614 [Camellia sinensis var. sinensis]
MTNDGKQKLHIVVFPWLAFGHMIPFLELAKNMARRGHQVSFLSTPRNIERLPRIPSNLSPLISLVKLHLPPVDGLPDNAEATIDLPSDKIHFLKKAYDGLKDELTQFLHASSPDWVVYDFAPYWLPPIAVELGIARAFFNAVNAWFLAFLGPSSALIDGSDPRTTLEDFTVPPKWIPSSSNLAHRYYEIKWIVEAAQNITSDVLDTYRLGSTLVGCNVLATRDCEENTELALGLEISGLPFFWALRNPSGLNESDSVELPDGFQDRTKGRGVVWTTWVPQLRILAHDSVGGFLTHCGWSSIIEGLQFGHPLIMLPFMVEQGLNARIFEKNKVGIEIPRDDRNGLLYRNSVAESLKLVITDDEGKVYRDKAREMRAIFGDKLRHDQYIDKFIEHLQNYRSLHKD